MTIECYKSSCEFHGNHFGEEGPFCFEQECHLREETKMKTSELMLWVWFRRVILWVTGRDLLKPDLPTLPQGPYCTIKGPPKPRWELTFSADAYVSFSLPTGPNVLHRLAQRFALGIRWRMLPKTP